MRLLVIKTYHREWELKQPLLQADDEHTVKSISLATQGGQEGKLKNIYEQILSVYKFNPDVVLFDGASGVFGALVSTICRITGTPFVYRIVGDVWTEHSEKLEEYREKDFIRDYLPYLIHSVLFDLMITKSYGYLTVSSELRDKAVEETGKSIDLVDMVHFPPKNLHSDSSGAINIPGISPDSVVLLTVTNLNYSGKFEGVKKSIREVSPILSSNENVYYIIAGDGIYYDNLIEHVNKTYENRNIKNKIIMPGFVDDVLPLYHRADVFVYISFMDGYPNSVIEAQISELPVIANKAHGMVEQIETNETGILVSEDGSGLETAVSRLLSNEDLRQKLGKKAARVRATENSPEKIGKELLASIEKIVGYK